MFRASQCLFLLSASNLLMQCLAFDQMDYVKWIVDRDIVQDERHLYLPPTYAPTIAKEAPRTLLSRGLAPAVIPTGAPIRQLAPAVIPIGAPIRQLAPAVI